MDRTTISEIAADAANLAGELRAKGFSEEAAQQLTAAAMPAIVANATETVFRR